MANYKVFNVRRRHEWLQKPLKKKRIKRRQAMRIGLWDAWERKKKVTAEEPAADEAATEES